MIYYIKWRCVYKGRVTAIPHSTGPTAVYCLLVHTVNNCYFKAYDSLLIEDGIDQIFATVQR